MGKLGKHDHKLTNLLKAGIFSLVMLAPLIAIGVKCLYVVNNKNAKDSYYGETINEEQTQQPTNLKIGNYYTFNTQSGQNTWTSNNEISVGNIQNINTNITTDISTANSIRYRRNNDDTITIHFYENTNWLAAINLTSTSYLRCTLQYLGEINTDYIDFFKETIYNNYSYLDNVFYYSIHNLEEQETFNWVQNTAIYTPLNAMCSGLGITESAIPILLCYWSLMTAIYIVFDIIIYLFTKMTHFIGTN